MKPPLTAIAILFATTAIAEQTRQLDAHEHGVGALDIAIDGTTVAMEFHAPGADIVGFEYAAESTDDRASISAAVATLARPLELFVFPTAAGCSVTQANAALESEDDHAEHDHDTHDDHEDHAEAASHTEFHAKYTLSCADPDALTQITFAYFDTFANALEVEVQVITSTGAQAFEVDRAAPTLDLRSLF